MSLTSKGAALLAFVALVGEVLASYGWLGLRPTSAAAFLVIFVFALIVFFLGLAFLPSGRDRQSRKESSGTLVRHQTPAQGYQMIEETTVRHERRVVFGPSMPTGTDPIAQALRDHIADREARKALRE